MTAADQIEDPSICIVRLGRGERISVELAKRLNPVDPTSFHVYRLPADTRVELHYHDFDEYWCFISGRPRVTLRSPRGPIKEALLEPGDMVACPRGIEHTLRADHELVYYQWDSLRSGGERTGHLVRRTDGG